MPAFEYENKDPAYFSSERLDVLDLITRPLCDRVLEIGAADGSTLVALKRSGKAKEVVGVELFPLSGSSQARQEIDRFIFADVEARDLDLATSSFDLLICADILEHLRDPWGTLQYLSTFLRPGGHAVISVPNILYWRAIIRILSGDFRYARSGVLDRTHLRFFCKKNVVDLVHAANFELISIEPSFHRHPSLKQDRFLNLCSFGLAEAFFAQQYLVLARKR